MNTRNTFHIRTGREGGTVDPWAYTEVTFTNLRGESMTLHAGLAMWVRGPDGKKQSWGGTDYDTKPVEVFAAFVGVEDKVIARLVDRQRAREAAQADLYGGRLRDYE